MSNEEMEYQDLRDGKTAKIVLNHEVEIARIRDKNPDLSAQVDSFASEARDRMQRLREKIDEFPETERDLVSILVINAIHKMCDEAFLG